MNIGRRECDKEHDIWREMAVDREKHEDSEDVTAWWIACCLSHPNFQQHAQTSSWLHWLPWLFCVSWLVSAVSSCFLRVLRFWHESSPCFPKAIDDRYGQCQTRSWHRSFRRISGWCLRSSQSWRWICLLDELVHRVKMVKVEYLWILEVGGIY